MPSFKDSSSAKFLIVKERQIYFYFHIEKCPHFYIISNFNLIQNMKDEFESCTQIYRQNKILFVMENMCLTFVNGNTL